ncbi:MAG: DUF3147 family protein [Phycisphaerales bacterium]|nr:DUF3147 family protein [Phycisphaerales bacterium]
MQYLVKVVVSALLIVLVSEVSKRTTLLGGLLASLPLTSFIAFIWLYVDTKDTAKIASLSTDIFWLVLPSLPFFLVLPALLKHKMDFVPALLISTGVLFACYLFTLWLLKLAAPASVTPTAP